jgi:hypothetical protein
MEFSFFYALKTVFLDSSYSDNLHAQRSSGVSVLNVDGIVSVTDFTPSPADDVWTNLAKTSTRILHMSDFRTYQSSCFY